MEARITNREGMKVTVDSDLNILEQGPFHAAKKAEVGFYITEQKIGFVRFVRLTDATYVFELNIKGQKVGLSYTIPQEGVDDSEYDAPDFPGSEVEADDRQRHSEGLA